MIQLLGVNGSLRATSSNQRLLVAAQALVPDGATLALCPKVDALPHFNPDNAEAQLTEHLALRRFVDQVRSSHGFVISTPVYAAGYPGVLKNALDWLVGTDAFIDKPFVLLNASDRVPSVARSLATVLTTMSGQEVANISVNLLGSDASVDDILTNQTHNSKIQGALQQLVATTAASALGSTK